MLRFRRKILNLNHTVQKDLHARMGQQTVAVIGAGRISELCLPLITDLVQTGSSGLSMLKTLREDGFKVTCYERRSRVGGLWAYTDDTSMTTALPSRISFVISS